MMKFTRPITREVEVGGERLAVTMGEQGVSFRPVGARRPPKELSWAAVLCCATGQYPQAGDASQVAAALQSLRSASAAPSRTESSPETHHEEATATEPAHGLQ